MAAALEHTSASPTTADPTVTVNTMHFLDLSGLTANRNFTLPAVAAVGDRAGVYITTGDDTYELIIKANTGDTLNGVSASEWSRVFITGEVVIMRCITANAAWLVEYDGRIPQHGVMRLSTTANDATTATFLQPTACSTAWRRSRATRARRCS